MPRVTRVQAALLAISGERFQQLGDAYLRRRGYRSINQIGLAAGTEKVRKGTPDSLFTLPNGRYVFAEYTTQQNRLRGKLLKDLNQCLDEERTGVPVSQIDHVVLCFTGYLSADDLHAIYTHAQERGVAVELIGIGTLSHDLAENHWSLAREYLGLEFDTGQIMEREAFAEHQSRTPFATSLLTSFRFREEEVQQIVDGMEAERVVVLVGKPGVGKTRLALECLDRLKSLDPDLTVLCITHSGPDLFNDLRHHLENPGRFALLVDDANRVNRFEYALEYLRERRPGREVTILATARDYAVDRVRDAAERYATTTLVQIDRLTDEQISDLLREELGIQNGHFLERISEVASGNPRLALMAGRTAVETGTLDGIADLSALYHEYFRSIRTDLEGVADDSLLGVAALLAFYRVVDGDDAELMKRIESNFGITKDAFWHAATRLHEFEVLDMYEGALVKHSDQVLASYLFYVAVFDRRVIALEDLIEAEFPRLAHRFVESLNPVFSVFDANAVGEVVAQAVRSAWDRAEGSADSERLNALATTFGFANPTRAFALIRDRVALLPAEPLDTASADVERDGASHSDQICVILSSLARLGESEARSAIQLALAYAQRTPSKAPVVVDYFKETFGFEHTSGLYGFLLQRILVEELTKAYPEAPAFIGRILLGVAPHLLRTRHHQVRSKGSRAFIVRDFEIEPTDEVLEIRSLLWPGIFEGWKETSLQPQILALFRSYAGAGSDVAVQRIIEHDAELVIPFLRDALSPDDYAQNAILHEYLAFLERSDVEYPRSLAERFDTPLHQLAEVLTHRWADRREAGSWEEYTSRRAARIESYFDAFHLEDADDLLDGCAEILAASQREYDEHQLLEGLTMGLEFLANRDAGAFVSLLETLLQRGNDIRLNGWRVVRTLLRVTDPTRALAVLHRPAYRNRDGWLFNFYEALPPEAVTTEHAAELLTLYRVGQPAALPYHLDFVEKLEAIEPGLLAAITRAVLDRAEEQPGIAVCLGSLFEPGSGRPPLLPLLQGQNELLGAAYCAAARAGSHFDHDTEHLSMMLELDFAFLARYVDFLFEAERERLDHFTQDFTVIWRRDDYHEVVGELVDRVYARESDGFRIRSHLERFFPSRSRAEEDLVRREDEFLRQSISTRADDADFIPFLFELISGFSAERRRTHLATFLQHNQNPDDFARLRLEPMSWFGSGSWVPVVQRRIEFWESLLPLTSGVHLLDHRLAVERQIESLRRELGRWKREDFAGD